MEKWQKAKPTTKRKQSNYHQLNHPNTQYNNYQQYPQQTVENYQQQGQRSSQNDLILAGKSNKDCTTSYGPLLFGKRLDSTPFSSVSSLCRFRAN